MLNSTSGTVTTVSNNTTDTVLAAGVPPGAFGTAVIVEIDPASAIQQAGVRISVDTNTGLNTYVGTKQIYVSIHCSFDYLKQGKGTDDYAFYIAKNGTVLPGSQLVIPDLDDITGVATLVYGTLLENTDTIALYAASVVGDDVLVSNYTMLIRE